MNFSRYVFVLSVIIGVHFFSCATTAYVQISKPPIWNTSAISRIAIAPFKAGGGASSQHAQLFTTYTTENILNTGKFTLVDYSEITKLERAKENIADHVDAILSGNIDHVEIKNWTEEHEGNDGKKTYTYYRSVDVDASYVLKRSGDGAIIGQTSLTEYIVDSASERSGLSSNYDLTTRSLSGIARNFKQYVAPWTAREERVFEEDAMKDKRMKQAKMLVKEGSYRAAHNLYAAIYNETYNFAAGYNAALCAEILGDLSLAARQMQELWETTGNIKAQTAVTRLQSSLSDIATLNQNYSGESNSLLAGAIKQAGEELLVALPARSRISLLSGRGDNRNTLEFVLEELTSALVATGTITVVDRERIDAIISEQRFQLSGEVSDETAVSIGRLSGSQIIVSCSITGASSQRRLRVRAIAVETGIVLTQISLQI
jgi:hypothetical protein